MTELVSTQGLFSTDEVEDYLRDGIVSRLNTVLGQNLKTIFDLAQFYPQIETGVKAAVTDFFTSHGIELTDFIIVGIVPPEEVQEKINERSSMGAVGNLDAYMKFKAAQSLEKAAENEGGGGMAGMGAGMGAGMMMANMMGNMTQGVNQQGNNQQQAAPKMSMDEIMSAIEKLGKMKEMGLITQEEFDTKKKDLLAKM
jgi:membrane protease subunit (stomatin/prohibitin family)